jgi:hypothetical protein
MVTQASLNQLANDRLLDPFASWREGQAPAGYVRAPISEDAVQFFRTNGYLVVEQAISDAEVETLNGDLPRQPRESAGHRAG